MNPDLYDAWHTAGAWLAGHWTGLAAWGIAIASLTVLAWTFWPRDDYRSRNDRREAAKTAASAERHPEPDQAGSNDADLHTCLQIMRATELARKEERP